MLRPAPRTDFILVFDNNILRENGEKFSASRCDPCIYAQNWSKPWPVAHKSKKGFEGTSCGSCGNCHEDIILKFWSEHLLRNAAIIETAGNEIFVISITTILCGRFCYYGISPADLHELKFDTISEVIHHDFKRLNWLIHKTLKNYQLTSFIALICSLVVI